MYIYIFYPKLGGAVFSAFHKAEKAAECAIFTIDGLITTKAAAKSKKKAAALLDRDLDLLPADEMFDEPQVQVAPGFNMDGLPVQPEQAIPAGIGGGNPPDWFATSSAAKKKVKKAKIDCGELKKLQEAILKAKQHISIQAANKVIEFYDDYSKYVLYNEMVAHEIRFLEDGKIPPKKKEKELRFNRFVGAPGEIMFAQPVFGNGNNQ